ncbi:MAG TPA: TetR family transcriptional regulator [Solirubrobacterales bacterium]|nr:TetR family transcriptional regulator [Solirubrobacterales bacterium]
MVDTPWGSSETLRDRRLPPGPGTPAEKVAENQRARLFGAMVASVSERGYAATRISDLSEISGVSKSTFYSLFESKQACFVATIDAMVDTGMAVATAAAKESDRGGTWEGAVTSVFNAFAAMVQLQPAAARTLLLEAHAGGSDALKPLERAHDVFERLGRERLAMYPEWKDQPVEILSAQIGVMQEIGRSRLLDGQEEQFAQQIPDLAKVALTHVPPPKPLRLSTRPPKFGPETIEAHDNAERAMRAFAVVAAERGYEGATVNEVVKRASMSPKTFYANFADREDVLLASIDTVSGQLVTAVLTAFNRSHGWPERIRAGFGSMLNFLASRPAMAHLLAVEVYAAGPRALKRRSRALEPLGALLAEGYEESPQVPAVASEFIGGCIVTLLYREIHKNGTQGLPNLAPICTYIALAPFIGPERAADAANGDGRGRGSSAPIELEAIRKLAVQPTKWNAFMAVSQGAATASEVSRELELPVAEVKRHLEELEGQGLIEAAGEGGPNQEGRLYQSTMRLRDADEWEGLSQEERERQSAEIGNLVKVEVERAVGEKTYDARVDRHLNRLSFRVDEQGWREVGEIHDAALHALLRVQIESAERLRQRGEKGINARSVQTSFEMPES